LVESKGIARDTDPRLHLRISLKDERLVIAASDEQAAAIEAVARLRNHGSFHDDVPIARDVLAFARHAG
jgi:hypothetical protein